MNSTPYFVLISLLALASCASYQSTSVPIQETVHKGKVKTINEDGDELLLKSITESDGNYYGRYKGTKILIDTTSQRKYYLKQDKKVYTAKIKLSNKTIKKGLLYEVTDSSIVIISNYIKTDSENYKKDQFLKEAYLVGDISKITIQNINAGFGKSVGIGFLAGAATGFIAGAIVASEEDIFGRWGSAGILAIYGGVVGATVGALVNLASMKTYKIKGDPQRLYQYESVLTKLAIINN